MKRDATMLEILEHGRRQLGEPLVKGECSDCGAVFEIGDDLKTAAAVIEDHMKSCPGVRPGW